MPRVSVILPTYNRSGLLTEALASVLAQTFGDWECLVSDDGSSDDTRDVLEGLAASDPRIRPLFGGHCGLLGRVRNRALEKARGSMVAFLDDDDRWKATKLATQLRLLEEEPEVGLLFCRAQRFGSARGVFPGRFLARRPKLARLWRGNFIPCSTVLLARDVLDRAGPFDEGLLVAQDYDLWLRTARIAPMRFQPETLCLYRVHAAAMSADRALEADALEEIYARRAKEWNVPAGWRSAAARHVRSFRSPARKGPRQLLRGI